MKTLNELLKKFDACIAARDWAGDKTIEEVVKECHNTEWLLWLAKKLELAERKLITCAGYCVNTVRHLMKDEMNIKLLDMCMNFEDESISFEDLNKAAYAASAAVYAAYAANASADVAAYAANASADAAAYAANASADAAANAAAAAYEETKRQTANIVRERLGQDIINKVNQLLNN